MLDIVEHVDDFDDFVKSKDTWFPDGNVIILAENTAFRLYLGLLMKHSSFFERVLVHNMKKYEKKI